jgi:hypothetical protein
MREVGLRAVSKYPLPTTVNVPADFELRAIEQLHDQYSRFDE